MRLDPSVLRLDGFLARALKYGDCGGKFCDCQRSFLHRRDLELDARWRPCQHKTFTVSSRCLTPLKRIWELFCTHSGLFTLQFCCQESRWSSELNFCVVFFNFLLVEKLGLLREAHGNVTKFKVDFCNGSAVSQVSFARDCSPSYQLLFSLISSWVYVFLPCVKLINYAKSRELLKFWCWRFGCYGDCINHYNLYSDLFVTV